MSDTASWPERLAARLATCLARQSRGLRVDPRQAGRLLAERPDGGRVAMNLQPPDLRPQPVSAANCFRGVEGVKGLLDAYRLALTIAPPLERDDREAMGRVDRYAERLRERILERAERELDDREARRIARWLGRLDLYVAIKACESLLNSRDDRALLGIAARRGWTLHLDHLAIRCGSEERGDARRVTRLLCAHHGYQSPQVESERVYRFDDGWDACALYKLLDNGQLIRLFIDESSSGWPSQIIQHWNRVYGYSAHHLALRATRDGAGVPQAVALQELIAALTRAGVATLTPTGGYTSGLLEQCFTRPAPTPRLPPHLVAEFEGLDPQLAGQVSNGKLIELVARREMPPGLAAELYHHYGLRYDPADPHHSAPAYAYFLPAQAAHVIRTSIEPGRRAAG